MNNIFRVLALVVLFATIAAAPAALAQTDNDHMGDSECGEIDPDSPCYMTGGGTGSCPEKKDYASCLAYCDASGRKTLPSARTWSSAFTQSIRHAKFCDTSRISDFPTSSGQ